MNKGEQSNVQQSGETQMSCAQECGSMHTEQVYKHMFKPFPLLFPAKKKKKQIFSFSITYIWLKTPLPFPQFYDEFHFFLCAL